jgi:hypothetical protein
MGHHMLSHAMLSHATLSYATLSHAPPRPSRPPPPLRPPPLKGTKGATGRVGGWLSICQTANSEIHGLTRITDAGQRPLLTHNAIYRDNDLERY